MGRYASSQVGGNCDWAQLGLCNAKEAWGGGCWQLSTAERCQKEGRRPHLLPILLPIRRPSAAVAQEPHMLHKSWDGLVGCGTGRNQGHATAGS